MSHRQGNGCIKKSPSEHVQVAPSILLSNCVQHPQTCNLETVVKIFKIIHVSQCEHSLPASEFAMIV